MPRYGPLSLRERAHLASLRILDAAQLASRGETMGRCSGIPRCCRRWFIDVWVSLDIQEIRAHRLGRRRHDGWDWGYVPCPGCRQCGARIRVIECEERTQPCEYCWPDHAPGGLFAE